MSTSMLFPDAEVLEATDGAEGLKHFDREVLDLIFMDVQMPVMDGEAQDDTGNPIN